MFIARLVYDKVASSGNRMFAVYVLEIGGLKVLLVEPYMM